MNEETAGNERSIEERIAALEDQNRILLSTNELMRAEARLTRGDIRALERICANLLVVMGKARSEGVAVRIGLAELAARTALRLVDPQHFMAVLEAGIDEAVQRITASRRAVTPLETEQLEEIVSTVDDLREKIHERFASLASPPSAPPKSGNQ